MDMTSKSEFDTVLSRILRLQEDSTVKIFGTDHKAVFMASYTTKHYPDDEYIKLFFADGTLLEIMPNEKEIFFCDDSRNEISRDLIIDDGKHLNIDGNLYTLENSNDTQIIKKIYFGDVADGESGCIFSDYVFEDEVWSLAKLENGQISDVHVRKIGIKDLSL